MTQYKHIYTGSSINVRLLESRLNEIGISPLIKDEGESGRLAGFAPSVFEQLRVFVHEDELQKAMLILDEVIQNFEE